MMFHDRLRGIWEYAILYYVRRCSSAESDQRPARDARYEIATFAARIDVAEHALITRLRVFDAHEAWAPRASNRVQSG
jgi:hypothetical protein